MAAEALPNRLLTAGVVIELVLIAGIDYTPVGTPNLRNSRHRVGSGVVALPFAAVLLVLDGVWKRHRGRVPNIDKKVTPPHGLRT